MSSNVNESNTTRIENVIRIEGARGWNILVTLLVTGGLTAIGYQFSLGPFADVVATGTTMFLVTLIGYMFKAGILRMPEKKDEGDLAFTKSTLRRIYDEIQTSIANSSALKLVLFAAGYTFGFLVLRAAMGFMFGLMTNMWVAIGIGLIIGGGIVAQNEILAWLRKLNTKKGA